MEPGLATLASNHPWDAHETARLLQGAVQGKGFDPETPDTEARLTIPAVIRTSAEKSAFMNRLETELAAGGVQLTKRGRLKAVVDELLMNAIYDAPNQAPASALFGKIKDRRREVTLDHGKKVAVSCRLRGREFFCSVRDPYGSLDARILTDRIETFLRESQVEVTQLGGEGGGVGLFMVLRNVTAFTAYVVPTQFTEISVRIDLRPGIRSVRRAKEIAVFYG
jgi:hypothetical protein